MNVVRLEWLRLWRTYRLLVLLVVFAFFGLLGPLTAAYLPEIVGLATQSEGLEAAVDLPEPVPTDGIVQYIGNISQLGLIVVAAIAAQALAIDFTPGLAAFYRTRQPSPRSWLVPRGAATTLAAGAAWTLGLLAAVYETVLLIGPLPPGATVLGWALWVVYLGFAVAVVALCAALARSKVAVIALSVGLLLAIALVGVVPQIGDWLPSHLVGAPAALVAQDATGSDFVAAAVVTVVATGAALLGAIHLMGRREL